MPPSRSRRRRSPARTGLTLAHRFSAPQVSEQPARHDAPRSRRYPRSPRRRGFPERPHSRGQKSRHAVTVRMADHGHVHAGHAQSRDANPGTTPWAGTARVWTACWRTAVRHAARPVAARPPGGSCRIRMTSCCPEFSTQSLTMGSASSNRAHRQPSVASMPRQSRPVLPRNRAKSPEMTRDSRKPSSRESISAEPRAGKCGPLGSGWPAARSEGRRCSTTAARRPRAMTVAVAAAGAARAGCGVICRKTVFERAAADPQPCGRRGSGAGDVASWTRLLITCI